jgi:hypothetical protein
MSPKVRSIVLLTAGALLFFAALAADSLGVGSQPGVGYKQLVAAVAGMVVAALGMSGLRR